jgi:hypothetical protein
VRPDFAGPGIVVRTLEDSFMPAERKLAQTDTSIEVFISAFSSTDPAPSSTAPRPAAGPLSDVPGDPRSG